MLSSKATLKSGLPFETGRLEPGAEVAARSKLFDSGAPKTAARQSWQEAAPSSIIENLYGPTEAAIGIAHYRWHSEKSSRECLNGIVPIGGTFVGEQFRVTDSRGEEVPIGEAGELCISGSQVASGY